MTSGGLRERKRERTRRHIADTAAGLFAERGYENVAMVDIAATADVAEQTVYNYFPTKEHLLLDLEDPLTGRLVQGIRSRPHGVTPAASIRADLLDFVQGIRSLPAEQLRGGLGHLAAISPTVRRVSLEMTSRTADALAVVITETTDLDPWAAVLQAVSIAWIIQIVTDETGRRTRDAQSPTEIADALGPIVSTLIDHVERWPAVGDA